MSSTCRGCCGITRSALAGVAFLLGTARHRACGCWRGGAEVNRRHFLTGTGALLVVTLNGCAGSSDVPVSVVSDAGLIAAGLAGAFKDVSAVPGAVVAALTDLASAAEALADADTIAFAQPMVLRIEADMNALVAAVGALPLPANAASAIQAAQVLLTVIEAGVNLLVTASAAPGAMTPQQARLVLAAAAAR